MKVINTLVFSGGGIKAVAYIGVFKKLEELIEQRKLNVENVPLIDIKTIDKIITGKSCYYLI